MKKKWFLIGLAALFVLAAAAGGVVWSGLLVVPTSASLAKASAVPKWDILEFQYQQELNLLVDYSKGQYSLRQPYVVQDPYRANPLSALILFETVEPVQITLTVQGVDAYSSFSETISEYQTHHEITVLGLYPGAKNRVSLTAVDRAGKTETVEKEIPTEPLPYDFPNLHVQVSQPEKMEPGVNLMTACLDSNYTYLLDARGAVRGYFTNKNFGHCTAMRVLKNGRLLTSGDVQKLMPYNMYTLWEMNLLGKVFTVYEIPNGVHHDLVELDNGDFLAVSNQADMPLGYDTREDVVIRIDRQTGQVKESYDLRQILDERREPYNHYDPGIQNSPNRDWAHLNSVDLSADGHSILVSSPIQSAVVKFNAATRQIEWILSSPEGWDGEFSRFQPYLLTPSGEPFEWQWGQHAAKFLPDSDGDLDTVDILLFDNGQARSASAENSLPPAQNYSRAVIYRVNEKTRTVEQLWQYGKERGSEAYATFLGDADLLARTGNVSIDFGGMLRAGGVAVDDIVAGVQGVQAIQSRVVEVRRDGELVFDVLTTPNHTNDAATYQVTRLDLYGPSVDWTLGEGICPRKGEVQAAQPLKYTLPKFFVPTLSFQFKQLYREQERLILQGSFQYQNQTYLVGKVLFVLKSSAREYVFAANPGINGNFEARLDLSGLEPGEYALYAAGGVVEGSDAQGKVKSGYAPTGYKVEIPPSP